MRKSLVLVATIFLSLPSFAGVPQVSLSAWAGDEALVFASLLQPGSGVWDIASGLTAPPPNIGLQC
jgi:hypothetical protein